MKMETKNKKETKSTFLNLDIAGHIKKEHDMYGLGILVETCRDTLMNGHLNKLIGKVEELFYTTNHPHNYHILIQQIIQFSSDGQQQFKSFLELHVIKHVLGVIEAMSSLSANGCALALVNL